MLGIPFEVQSSQAEESTQSAAGPNPLAQENARLKALDIATAHPDRWVLGSDTVVALGDESFGKPASMQEAVTMLEALQGKTHQVFTGVCLVNLAMKKEKLWSEVTNVSFRPLNIDQIKRYLGQMNPLDKAGAYAIQDGGEQIVSRVEGSLSNVVGLPLESVEQALEDLGIQ